MSNGNEDNNGQPPENNTQLTPEQRRANIQAAMESARQASGGGVITSGIQASGGGVKGFTPSPKEETVTISTEREPTRVSQELRAFATRRVGQIERIETSASGKVTFIGATGKRFSPSSARLVATGSISEAEFIRRRGPEPPQVPTGPSEATARARAALSQRESEFTTTRGAFGPQRVAVPRAAPEPLTTAQEQEIIRTAQALKTQERIGRVSGVGAALAGTGEVVATETAGLAFPIDTEAPALSALFFPLGKIRKAGKAAKAVGRITKATAATTAAAKKAAEAAKKASRTQLGTFGKGLIAGEAVALTAPPVSEKIGEITAPKDIRDIVGSREVTRAVDKARAASEEKLRERGILTSIGAELPFGGRLEDTEFNKVLTQELQGAGFQGTELEQAVKAAQRRRTAGDIGELTGLIGISSVAELTGRSLVRAGLKTGVQTTKKQLTGQLFKRFAPRIGAAGIIEGAAQETAQQQARGREFDLQQQALMGAFGFGTAGLLGGAIGATRPLKPTISRTLDIGASIADPLEKPGDFLANIIGFTRKKITGKAPPTPRVRIFTPAEDIVQIGLPGPKARGRAPAVAAAVPTQIKPESLEQIIGQPTRPRESPNTIIPSAPIAPVPTDTTIPITPPPITAPTFISTETPTEVTTSIFAPTLTTIPTPTPLFRVPPPVPIGLPLGTGGTGARKGKGKKFIDELAQGRRLLGVLSGPGISTSVFGAAPRRKKAKKGKRRRR